jgi:Putative peptidoglycan binding domain
VRGSQPRGRQRLIFGQRRIFRLEPTRAAATVIYALLALVAVAVSTSAALYRTDIWPQQWRFATPPSSRAIMIVTIAATGFAVLLLVAATVNGRRWHLASAVRRLSEDPELASLAPDGARTAESLPAARDIPPLSVQVLKPRQLPRPRNLQRVTAGRNVVGGQPLSIAYLRLFDNQPRTRTFVQGAWREFGYVYLLRSSTSVTPSEFRQARRSGHVAELFVRSQQQFVGQLDRPRDAPSTKHWRAFNNIAPLTIRTWDRYGSYPPQAILCHGSVWKAAVDILLERVDLVVLDLSGFMSYNRATRYELQRVVDHFPIERVVFLADTYSNRRFLREQLQEAWSHMAAGSPNSGMPPRVACIAVTDHYREVQQQQGQQQGQSTPPQIRLVASRGQSRRVAAAAQKWGNLMAPGREPEARRPDVGMPESDSLEDDDGTRRPRGVVIGAGAAAALLAIGTVVAIVLAGHAGPSRPSNTGNSSACASTHSCAFGDREFFLHASGTDVAKLQQRLQYLGFYKSTVDGKYGLVTKAAVRAFQVCVGLPPDGIAGRETIPAIRHATPTSVAPCFQAGSSPPTSPPTSSPTSPPTSPPPSPPPSPPTSPPTSGT